MLRRLGFRPLTGILFSNKQNGHDIGQKRLFSFPSPHGDFVFEQYRDKDIGIKMGVSVPSRGFCFRTYIMENEKKDYLLEFPSPHGDFVFERESVPVRISGRAVSVPSRGFCFRTRRRQGRKGRRKHVSVPSRGFCFRTAPVFAHHPCRRRKKFPSPHGDFVFEPSTSPASTASYFRAVSVPSRGFCFRTSLTISYCMEKVSCFRPLTGILFSNRAAGRKDSL